MVTATRKLTYADYAKTPDDVRCELLDGELIELPSPVFLHQLASARIGYPLQGFVVSNDLGIVLHAPMDVHFSDADIAEPDIMFISHERSDIIGRWINGAPDLVVEILSPSTAHYDLNYKRELYARCDVKEYWIGDTDTRTIAVLLLVNGAFEEIGVYGPGDTLTSPTLPGFALSINDVF